MRASLFGACLLARRGVRGAGATGQIGSAERRGRAIAVACVQMLVERWREALREPVDESGRESRAPCASRGGRSAPPSTAVDSLSAACVGHRPLWSFSR
jgi:hypothetical protein